MKEMHPFKHREMKWESEKSVQNELVLLLWWRLLNAFDSFTESVWPASFGTIKGDVLINLYLKECRSLRPALCEYA